MYFKINKWCLYTRQQFLRVLVAGFFTIVDEYLFVEESFEVLINIGEIDIQIQSNVIQVSTNTTGTLYLLSGRGVQCLLYIVNPALQQP